MIISPRPITNNSRSTRVIEELQETLEGIEREIGNVKTQLEQTRESQSENERETKRNVEDNQRLREEITGITQTLESKQTILEEAKRLYREGEARVKALKGEAMEARKSLEQAGVKQKELDKARSGLGVEQARWGHQQQQLTESIRQCQTGLRAHLASDQAELERLRQALETIRSFELNQRAQVCLGAEEREGWVKALLDLNQQLEQNTQSFLNQITLDLNQIKTALESESPHQESIAACLQTVQAFQAQIPK